MEIYRARRRYRAAAHTGDRGQTGERHTRSYRYFMQYANTSRGGVEANNASFAGTPVIRVSAAGGVVRGQPVLLPYKCSSGQLPHGLR